mgnify:FL=1
MRKLSRLILTYMEYEGKEVLAAATQEQGSIRRLSLSKKGQDSILGNIYIGKVKNIVKNIRAAFIEIENKIMCYYSLDEKCPPFLTNRRTGGELKIGDELLVQVSKEAMKSKLPCVTGNLNFTGRYLVLTSGRRELGFSAKLKKEEQKRLRKLLEGQSPKDAGLIVRTNAAEASPEEILKELKELAGRYELLKKKAVSRVCFSLLEQSMPRYLKAFQDAYIQDLEEIVTDDEEIYGQLMEYTEQYPENTIQVRLYRDKLLPLYKLYSLESVLEGALNKKVWLKSGGFLVIEQTEAFVSIDVNTGKFSQKKEVEETFRKINLEAAKEIALQLRLRNLSGIILIDFINMENPQYREELMKTLQAYLRQDPIKGNVVDMTPLNIVEVTRKKVEKPLAEEVRDL